MIIVPQVTQNVGDIQENAVIAGLNGQSFIQIGIAKKRSVLGFQFKSWSCKQGAPIIREGAEFTPNRSLPARQGQESIRRLR